MLNRSLGRQSQRRGSRERKANENKARGEKPQGLLFQDWRIDPFCFVLFSDIAYKGDKRRWGWLLAGGLIGLVFVFFVSLLVHSIRIEFG